MIRAIKRWFQRALPDSMGEHGAGQRAIAVHVYWAGRTTKGIVK